MSDIVERLRIFGGGLCHEAADEIERLQREVSRAWAMMQDKEAEIGAYIAEIERLQTRSAPLPDIVERLWTEVGNRLDAADEIDRLRTEIKRLKEPGWP